jgi:rsbT co-antagonist protein RsbR
MSEAESQDSVAVELTRALDYMLDALNAIARGDERILETSFADDHPVGALAAAINDVSMALNNSRAERLENEAQLNARIELIERQRQAIAELSTPVIEVWSRVLTLPVVGTVDSERASKMTIELLDSVVSRDAALVILDVTGLEIVDTAVADHFLRMARSVRLLGAQCVLSGVRPAVASTIVTMGLEVGEIECFSTLRAALQHGTKRLGLVQKTAPATAGGRK